MKSKSEYLTDVEIRIRGWQALVRALGAVGAMRYVRQTEPGLGDYAAMRHRKLGAATVDDLLRMMERDRAAAPRPAAPVRRRRRRP